MHTALTGRTGYVADDREQCTVLERALLAAKSLIPTETLRSSHKARNLIYLCPVSDCLR